jgi:uncharacterized protein (DUF1697 family)
VAAYVAFLRGINVGRHRRVSMANVKAAFDAAGAENATTYLQSGNVLCESRLSAAKLAPSLERELQRRLGLEITVVVRTRSDLARLVDGNPWSDEADGKKVHVAFLEAAPKASAVARLDRERVAPDEFRVAGRDIYLHYPRGYGRSKLTNDYLEKQLGIRSTMRNWKTVTALAGLSGAKSRER